MADADVRKILKQYWGFDNYLPLQREAIQSVLDDRDSLVVMPTGGGKSLCYQAPALCREGVAVVVSPLLALMKDQVDALVACGVPAAAVNSTHTLDEKRRVAQQVESGQLRLLYMSPERLVTSRTLDFLANQQISFFAIDESHCISAWGHDFRPEYRALRTLRDRFPKVAVHAYTATATEQVRRDIIEQLGLRDAEIIIGDFYRANLQYHVARRERGLGQICQVIDRYRGESGIIYCISRAEVDKTAAVLREMGFAALPYHAGMSDEDRIRNQDAFLTERADIIVATVAFGMGIDKSNIRFVIHAGMPKSLEHYQQETGRAGRDRRSSECWLFYKGSDLMTWQRLLSQMPVEAHAAAIASLEKMNSYATAVNCRHAALVQHFGQKWTRGSCEACDVCLGNLEVVDDPLIIGQKILSCVLRLNENFGVGYVCRVLVGSKDQRILGAGHEKLSTYGLLKKHGRQEVRQWIEQLVAHRFLAKVGEFNLLQVTDTGRQLLRGEITPTLRSDNRFFPAASSRTATSGRVTQSTPSASAVQSFPLFDEGLSVEQVAERLGRAISTTMGYLEAYIRQRRVTEATRWLTPHEFRRIDAAVRNVGGGRLRPIFDAVNGEIPYERIRIGVACLQNQLAEAEASSPPCDNETETAAK